MEGDFIKLYLNHKNINTASKTQRSSNNPCFGYYNKSIDPKLRTDINSVQNTFKDFLTPINNIRDEVDRFDKQTKDKHENRKMFFSALSPISTVRRVSAVTDNIENGNMEKALGLVGLAVVNLPEDTRDLKFAFNQVFKGELPKYDYKNYQHSFSFFRGTVLEPIVNKMGKFGVWLHKKDISLFDTNFGKFLRKKLNISYIDIDTIGRKVPKVINEFGKIKIDKVLVKAYKLEGKKSSKLIGKALLRISRISVYALGLLELPSIIKSFKNSDNPQENIINGLYQTLKSGINITSILGGIGLTGALLARKGPAGSLLGMGLGSVAGAYVSNKIGDGLDSIKDKYQC